MSTYAFETPLGIDVRRLVITRFPRIATLTFTHAGRDHSIQFTNPLPLSPVIDALDECWQIRIVDGNADGMQREFGRYNVELWDEDNPFTEFTVDSFEHNLVDAKPGA